MIITSIFNTFISKFCYQQKLSLVILLEVNKKLKIYFYYTILLFYFIFNLKAKYNRWPIFNTKKVVI